MNFKQHLRLIKDKNESIGCQLAHEMKFSCDHLMVPGSKTAKVGKFLRSVHMANF